MACLLPVDIDVGSSVLDVGSGAGFPGIPMKIARPDLRMTLLEAARRRAAFLELAARELDIDLDVINGRAEVVGHLRDRRERFDVVVSRATAPLPRLVELCLPFARIGGFGIFPKGGNIGSELASAASPIREAGGGLARLVPIETPWDRSRKRVLVVIAKVSPTPARFPRTRLPRGRSY